MVEFSRKGYINLINTFIENNYQFIPFSDVKTIDVRNKRYCLMRHDVDVSMEHAYDMAKIEAKLGVYSTYFVMFRSPIYNLMSRHSSNILKEIVSLGHEVGLHFDGGYRQSTMRSIEESIIFEVSTLETLLGRKVSAFSLHQPTEELLNQNIEVNDLTNTYHKEHLSEFEYISDSNRVWKEKTPFDLINDEVKRIHFLAHPIWWMNEHIDIQDCWDEGLLNMMKFAEQQILSTERSYLHPRKLIIQRSDD